MLIIYEPRTSSVSIKRKEEKTAHTSTIKTFCVKKEMIIIIYGEHSIYIETE